jgi:ATP-dependent Lon protease
LKEKLLGADRAGVKEVILPRGNAADVEDVPADVRDRLRIIPVDALSEILVEALRPRAAEVGA